ncbi:MAG: 3-oxoacyl-[acyl-carrier protein] reductase [Solirubrobacteraceae bacterium]|nr:3-oxoacyl-[acyl-carrier protein] reductase [Solirubrobacteraceae bacterium]
MADRYQQFVDSPPGRLIAGQLGLPKPAELRRYEPGQPLVEGSVLVGGGGQLAKTAADVLRAAKAKVVKTLGDGPYGAVVYDASAIAASPDLHELYAFFHDAITRVGPSGRVIVLGTPPELAGSRPAAIAQRALEGFTRAVAKEVRNGSTAQLVYVAPGAEANLAATLRFLASAKSAYVDAQVIRIGAGESSDPDDWEHPLAGRIALVTGASRGIGESIATVLARDGAHVVCLDIPAAGEQLAAVANRLDGSALQLDITADDAPERLVEYLKDRHGGVDVVVHNAGVTKDKTLARMSDEQWDMLMAVNLTAPERLTDALLESGALRPGGRVVGVSSISGIAGQRGQSNYSTSKAGVIGFVQAMAPVLAEQAMTVNAVAPGFIETQMTAAMPFATREVGRRLNSLSQGGRPVDVAETVAWLASPGAGGVNGNIVRVCGQNLLGA